MRHEPPAPPELGRHDGLAYALFLPKDAPTTGVVILHGAGSAKASHFDFARAARAHGFAALAYDARGHGASEGSLGPGAVEDARAMSDLLREHVGTVALRGSSMGGFFAIQAAAMDPEVAAVVAICPAPEDFLLRGLRSGRLIDFEADRDALDPWLERTSLSDAVRALAPRTALLLLHAEGDEQIPYTVSQELYRSAGQPKRLLLLPGGHHRSIQHDGELQGESLRFIAQAVTRAGGS
jgi:pimeloyl-ACP methyl ester carboxylesterase